MEKVEKDNVINLAIEKNDATMWAPKDALWLAIKDIENNQPVFGKAKKVLIIALDDTEGNYETRFIQAGMKSSECLALCEVMKTVFTRNLLRYGY